MTGLGKLLQDRALQERLEAIAAREVVYPQASEETKALWAAASKRD